MQLVDQISLLSDVFTVDASHFCLYNLDSLFYLFYCSLESAKPIHALLCPYYILLQPVLLMNL